MSDIGNQLWPSSAEAPQLQGQAFPLTITIDAQLVNLPIVLRGRTGARATMRHDTVCAICHVGFRARDEVLADLAMPPAEGTWRHRDCAPALVVNPNRLGFGFGIMERAVSWSARDGEQPEGAK